MKEYVVLSPIKHDDDYYQVGESIELSDRHAAPLLASGDIADKAPGTVVSLADAIVAMVNEDPEKANAEWWTADGKPETAELSKRVGARVSAISRAAAWAAHTA